MALLQGIERFARFAWESVVEGSAKAIIGVLAMGLLWRSALSGMAAVAASCVVGLLTYLLVTLPLLGEVPSRQSRNNAEARLLPRAATLTGGSLTGLRPVSSGTQ